MESTGVYWIPLFQILEARGLEVCLVNARYFQNVPGRRTDVSDCQWLRYLHSVGLLRSSFRPADQVCVLRSLARHRESLIQTAATHVLRTHKALDQMNLQIHHVINDITGLTGLKIVNAILRGERDPKKLAALRDGRIKATEQTIAKSLVGDYRREHLFTLCQSLAAYRNYQKLVAECDREIERQLKTFEARVDCKAKPLPPPKVRRHKFFGNEPNFDLRKHLYRIFGVDLTEVPGMSILTAHTLLAEVGPDLSRFPNASAFSSWLGLCPDNDITIESFQGFFKVLGQTVTSQIEFVCSDMWQPFLDVIREKCSQALHILDRFHIVAKMNKALDEVRAAESRRIAREGHEPLLKRSRWCILKRKENLTYQEKIRLRDLLRYNLQTVRAYLLKEDFQQFWDYNSPTWAGMFLDFWCFQTMRSRIEPSGDT